MPTLTAANAAISLAITNLFPTAQLIQGFSADDVFTTDVVTPVETLMGVDGWLSGGWVATAKTMTISLQADSPSNFIFEQWHGAQQMSRECDYIASGIFQLSALGWVWTATRGFLSGVPVMPDARRILQPRRYRITWGEILGAPI
jgi:hypothetical protein